MTLLANPGFTLTYSGQRFVCVAVEPYTRRDGRRSKLAVWEARCAVCHTAFNFKTSTYLPKFEPSRRCAIHKRPGVPVNSNTKTASK